jgi:hypothetical protein
MTKEELVAVLRDLGKRIAAKRAELEAAVEAGTLSADSLEHTIATCIPEIESEVHKSVSEHRG